VIVRPQAAGFQVYTTPFTGAADRAPFERGPLPLAGMAVLRKAERAQAPQPLDGSALAVMAAAVVAQYPATAQYAAKVLESLSHLVGVCAVQILPFTKRELVLPE
jgi:threonine/homoserine efflux transporter RhtA